MLKPFLTLAALCVAFSSCSRSVQEPEAETPSIFRISETESSAIAQPASWGDAKVSVRCVDEKVVVKHTPASGDGEYVAVFGKKGHEYFHVIEAENRAGAPQGSDPEWGAYYDIDGDGYADFRKKQSTTIYEKRTGESWAVVDESEFREARSSWTELLQRPSSEAGLVWSERKGDTLELLVASPESWRNPRSSHHDFVTIRILNGKIALRQGSVRADLKTSGLILPIAYPAFVAAIGVEGLYGFGVYLSPGTGTAVYRDYTGDGDADCEYFDGVYKMREGAVWTKANYDSVEEAYKKMFSKKER